MSVKENKQIVRQLIEVVNAKRPEPLQEFFASRTFLLGTIEASMKTLAAGFPDYAYTIDELLGEDEKVAACITIRGTNTGSFQGRPPSGRSIEAGIIYVITFKEGKIQSLKFEINMLLIMQQLGWLQRPDIG